MSEETDAGFEWIRLPITDLKEGDEFYHSICETNPKRIETIYKDERALVYSFPRYKQSRYLTLVETGIHPQVWVKKRRRRLTFGDIEPGQMFCTLLAPDMVWLKIRGSKDDDGSLEYSEAIPLNETGSAGCFSNDTKVLRCVPSWNLEKS